MPRPFNTCNGRARCTAITEYNHSKVFNLDIFAFLFLKKFNFINAMWMTAHSKVSSCNASTANIVQQLGFSTRVKTRFSYGGHQHHSNLVQMNSFQPAPGTQKL